MSTTRADGTKIVISREDANFFWATVEKQFAANNSKKWKHLGMLALRETAHWSIESIAQAFGHPKGYVSRCLAKIKQELRDQFEIELLEEGEIVSGVDECRREQTAFDVPQETRVKRTEETTRGVGLVDSRSNPFTASR